MQGVYSVLVEGEPNSKWVGHTARFLLGLFRLRRRTEARDRGGAGVVVSTEAWFGIGSIDPLVAGIDSNCLTV